jgi:hypothetical protein
MHAGSSAVASAHTSLFKSEKGIELWESTRWKFRPCLFPCMTQRYRQKRFAFQKPGIRCIELESGKQVWHHPDLWTNHLAFATADFNFYCVAMMHDPPNNCSLVRLAPRLMDCDQVAFVGLCWEAAFSQSGNFLVTMRGHVYETSTGRLLRQLGFPQRDYPDH